MLAHPKVMNDLICKKSLCQIDSIRIGCYTISCGLAALRGVTEGADRWASVTGAPPCASKMRTRKKTEVYEGVLVEDLLKKAGVAQGEALRDGVLCPRGRSR